MLAPILSVVEKHQKRGQREMPELIALARNIRKIRQEKKLSQLEFALESDISLDILSMIERQRTNPRLSTLQKIAAYTGKTVAELLTPPEEPKSK